MKKQLDLIFPQRLIQEPLIHRLSKEFDIVFNIRRAKVTEHVGELILELEGSETDLEEALAWLKKQGVRVEPATHDAVEG